MINEQLQAQAQAPAKSSFTSAPRGLLQRKCACGGTPGPTGECEACRKKRLQRKAQNRELGIRNDSPVPPIVHEVLRSPGQPLDPATRAFMEPRFGHDFSQVRVHTDERAAESAQAVNALAYTVGRNVVFGSRHYAPQTSAGQRLLAHELTHVTQQGSQRWEPQQIGPADDAYEREANQIATSLAARPFLQSIAPAPLLQRKDGGKKQPAPAPPSGPSHKANDPYQLKSELHPRGKALLFADQVASIYFGTKS